MKPLSRLMLIVLFLSTTASVHSQSNFQPYNTQGDNLIHVTTADFDGVGTSDYVVGMSVEGKVITFQRPDLITDPSADNRIWEYQTPTSFNLMIIAGDAISSSPGEEILVPGTDGHLRILSASGVLLHDWTVGTGALYSADVGVNSAGQIRIVTGGVDGNVYILNESGAQVGLITPLDGLNRFGVIRRVVVGNFDGTVGDEVVSFFDVTKFSGNNYFEITDLSTLTRPSYWAPSAMVVNDVQEGMGWEDKQLPWAYDMDEDGDDELVGHWGVLHPELGAGTQTLSTMLATGERLRKQEEYIDVNEDSDTGKYVLEQSVPGNFRNWANFPGPEMVTIYGDDLYLVDYDTVNEDASSRFRVKDYGYAHTLYHFTNGARLENRNSVVDKLVLAGPPNGDDHFYVVNLNTATWDDDAKTIDGNGVLGTVRNTLDALEADVGNFTGTAATAGDPIWFIHYFASYMGWEMTPANIQTRVGKIKAAMQVWNDELFGVGHVTQRINWAASISIRPNGGTIDPNITQEGLIAFAAEMAANEVHFCLDIGNGPNEARTPAEVADIFEAAVVDGHCYMMARTKELRETDYIDVYKPHMDAVIARAALLGVAPPKVMLCGKGPIFSTMDPTQAATYFPAYKDVLVPGVENSNVTVLDWSFSERAGLWLNGDVESWGCNSIGDNLAANRIAEYGGMRNGHVVLRHLLSQYALGADVFRITSIQGQENPLFTRGDTTDPEYSSAYRQGIFNFLKLVETGVYPNTPDRSQLKGVSPVAAALYGPDYNRLREQSINHEYRRYEVPVTDYVINNLACWAAYTDVPDFDATAILFNTRRRWDNLLPTSPSGFVAMVPYATRAELESNGWCKRAYETDGNTWDEFVSLTTARDTIAGELDAQKLSQLFYVENECFWQVTQQKEDATTLFAVLMDSGTQTPTDRTVQVRLGSAAGAWEVYDQFGSQLMPLGTLGRVADAVEITIPAGGARFLCLKRIDFQRDLAIGWDGVLVPSTQQPGIAGALSVGHSSVVSTIGNSTDGFYGPDSSYSGASTSSVEVYKLLGSEHSATKSYVDISIINNTGVMIGLDAIVFDFSRWFTNSPTSISVTYLSGDLDLEDSTLLASYADLGVLGTNADYNDFSVSLAGLADVNLAVGESASFRLQAAVANGANSSSGLDNVGVVIIRDPDYALWAAEIGLVGNDALGTADVDSDGVDNLYEYALGGDPLAADAPQILPQLLVPDPQVNGLDFSYQRRKDYLARGLSYEIDVTPTLNPANWTATDLTVVNTSSIDADFDTITHRISTDTLPSQFIRLTINEE
jgi:hypothetical protein